MIFFLFRADILTGNPSLVHRLNHLYNYSYLFGVRDKYRFRDYYTSILSQK